jgi:ketosteroid isomerase-like protein
MERAPLLLALLPLLAGSCRTAASEVGELRALIDRQQASWNAGDVERFLRIGYWDSPELTFYSGGDAVRGFDTVLERYLSRYKAAGAETGELTFTDVVVEPLGDDHAFARGHWHVDFEKKEDQGGLFTLVLARKPEGWRIVHDHTSVAEPKTETVQ